MDNEQSHQLFDQVESKEQANIVAEMAQDNPDSSTYVQTGIVTDLKSSIIEVTRPKDERMQELLVKELSLSNIGKNEVRTGMLFVTLILSFYMHGEVELAREWHTKMVSWLLLNRSVDFRQQEILATQIKSLMTHGSSNKEKKELI